MRSRTAPMALALALACSDPEPSRAPDEPAPSPSARVLEHAQQMPSGLARPSALADALPERIGSFARTGEPEPDIALGITPTTRVTLQYADGERRASVRVVDAARAPELVAGFAAAQRIGAIDPPGSDELVPTGIANRPGLASWSPATSTSEAQVVVSERFVVALTITPAQVPEESVDLLDGLSYDALEQLGSP